MNDIIQAWEEGAIYETIASTENEDGSTRVAPLGARRQGEHVMLAPFAPSRTLDNIRRSGQAVVNLCQDVTIFAGCITGRHDWPTEASSKVRPQRLRDASAHLEVQVVSEQGTGQRASFACSIIHAESHAPFIGHNRARAAVVEAAVHVSRIGILPTAQIRQYLDDLQPQIDKTAGPQEEQAWQWLLQHLEDKGE